MFARFEIAISVLHPDADSDAIENGILYISRREFNKGEVNG